MKKVLKKKVFKCLQVSKDVEIGLLRLATLPQVIVDVVKVVDIGLLRPSTLPRLITEVVNVGQV